MKTSLTLCDVGPTGIGGLESFSPFTLKVHRALALAELPYATRRGKAPGDFKDLNPAGQVPVLLEGDEPIYDSTRILLRIAELAPDTIVPTDPRRRALVWLWEDWADRSLVNFVLAARWADDKNWPNLREAFFGKAPWIVRKLVAPQVRRKVLDTLKARDVTRHGLRFVWDDLARILDQLEALAPLTGFWAGAERPSVADIAIFAHLRSLRTPLTPEQARIIEMRPALVDWLDRVDAETRSTPRLVKAAA